MKRVAMIVMIAAIAGCINWSSVYAEMVSAKVLDIGTYATNTTGGATFFVINKNAVCPSSPTVMWADPAAAVNGMKAAMSLLLLAKTMDKEIYIYYSVDSNGYCRYQTLQLP